MQQWNGFDQLDLSNVEAGGNYLKAGQYRCQVTKAKVEPNKAKTGMFVQVELRCLDGYGNAVERFNVSNPNNKAVEIGLSKLKNFLIEANHPNPDKPGNIDSLVGLKVGVNVKPGDPFVNEKGEKCEGRGEIAGFFKEAGVHVNGPAPKARRPASAQAAPAGQPAGADTFDDDIPF